MPPRTAYVGEDHWPCMMFDPGLLSVQRTFPVDLVMARKLGASGYCTLSCASSTPFDVHTSRRSPAEVSEQLHALCCETPSSDIRSKLQTISASSLFSLGSSLYGPSFFPSRKPSVSRQRISL